MISSNHPSATANPAPVAQELESELSLNRKVEPFLAPTFSNFVWSLMDAIPKKHSQPPKCRNIDDLLWLAGQSVNDAFSKELHTCSYDSIDQAISYLKSFGPNALISKLDLSDAFHHILVDPCDWKILGSTWPLVMSDGSTRTGYFFTFDFRLVSEVRRCYFLNLLSGCDTRWHSMEPLRNYPPCFGPVALPPQAPLVLGILMLCFVPLLTSDLLPIPFQQFLLQRTLCFLASNSTMSQELRIDPTRLAEIMDLLDAWSTKQHCSKRQLRSLIGNLHSIYAVCRPGITSLRRMLDVLCRAHHLVHHLRLNHVFYKDLLWWRIFLPSWNGRSFSMTTNRELPHSWIFTLTYASLASVPLTQVTGSTGPSRTRRPTLPFNYFQGPLRHYRCGQHLGSIP